MPNIAPQQHSTSPDDGSSAIRDDGDQVAVVLEPILSAMGYEVVAVEWVGAGRQRRLQVFLDREGGITLNDCARLSPVISNALDAAEATPTTEARGETSSETRSRAVAKLLATPYTLEVSSPGLDRPLRQRSHFARFEGERATIRTLVPVVEGSQQRTFHGRIGRVESDPLAPEDQRRGQVSLHDETGTVHVIPISSIRRANLVFEG